MNQKTTRKYELIANIANNNLILPNLAELCDIDFQTAFEMWEFTLARTDSDGELVRGGLKLFQTASETKTRQLFCESLPLQKLVYTSSVALDSNIIAYLAALIVAAKLDTADECLSKMRANIFIDFNEALRTVLDATFAQSCQKTGARVPSFNKKQRDLLINYINKIKGPNKALLLQRMKEL